MLGGKKEVVSGKKYYLPGLFTGSVAYGNFCYMYIELDTRVIIVDSIVVLYHLALIIGHLTIGTFSMSRE